MINHLEKDLRDREQFLRRIEKEKKKALQRAPQGRLRYSKKESTSVTISEKTPKTYPGPISGQRTANWRRRLRRETTTRQF